MLIVEVKDNESIDKALRPYKLKFRNAKVLHEIGSHRHYTKPSIERRHEVLKAIYKQQEAKG